MQIHVASDVGPTITRARREVGLSQQALAEEIGTSQSAVSRWEHGHDEPRLRTLIAIFAACGKRMTIDLDRDVDRAQIRQQLAMSPRERLASVVNVSRVRAQTGGL